MIIMKEAEGEKKIAPGEEIEDRTNFSRGNEKNP